MKKTKGDYSIQTVINALRLLEEFADADELGVTALSHRLELHKNNVFRLLATLEERGYVEQSPETERYKLGVRVLQLGRAFFQGRSLLRRGRPILEELARAVGETAHVGVLRNFEVIHVDGESADRLVLTTTRVGSRLPLHCTALGKVLLGCGPDRIREEFDEFLGESGLERRTDITIVDRDKFFEHLRSVKVQGFALDLGECEEGLYCAAAPVFDATGALVAGISISAVAFRLGEDELIRKILPQVTEASERLSRDLGYAP